VFGDSLFGRVDSILHWSSDGVCTFAAAKVPVLRPAGLLHGLSGEIGRVTCEEEVIAGLHLPCEAHEHQTADA
jgi:hypothetical protein